MKIVKVKPAPVVVPRAAPHPRPEHTEQPRRGNDGPKESRPFKGGVEIRRWPGQAR